MQFLISALGCAAAAALNARFRPGPWYEALRKPRFTPPNAVFPVVWTVLFAMMAVSAGLLWRRAGLSAAGPALTLFALQLVVNASWSWLFFGRRVIGAALVALTVLWVLVLVTIIAFAQHDALATALLCPYFAWLTLAAILNLSIWNLNRTRVQRI